MTKAELIKIAETHRMDFIRQPITDEGVGVWCESIDRIPELDAICDRAEYDNVMGTREIVAGMGYVYKLYCPRLWIDLCGWSE